jgi:hypothetical protein
MHAASITLAQSPEARPGRPSPSSPLDSGPGVSTSPPPPHVCMCARVACSQHVTSHELALAWVPADRPIHHFTTVQRPRSTGHTAWTRPNEMSMSVTWPWRCYGSVHPCFLTWCWCVTCEWDHLFMSAVENATAWIVVALVHAWSISENATAWLDPY